MTDSTKRDGKTETSAGERPDRQTGGTERTRGTESGEDRPTSAVDGSRGRRPFLKGLPLPPLIAALAGCDSLPTEESSTTAPESPDDGPGEGTTTPTPDPTVEGGLEPGDTVPFADAITFEGSFRLTGEIRSDSGDTAEAGATRVSGRATGLDYRLTFESDAAETETVVVDGDRYEVTGDGCLRYPDVSLDESDLDSDRLADVESVTSPDLTFVGTETVADRQVLAYELEVEYEGDAEVEGELPAPRFYVGPETNYLYGLETDSAVFRFEDWAAEVPAVQPPGGDCRTVAVPEPGFWGAAVGGEVVENGVAGLKVVEHDHGAGTYGSEAVEAPGFHVRLTVRNDGDAVTDLLSYDYEVVTVDEDGDRRSGDGATVWSFASPEENRVAPGTAGVVVVSPEGLDDPDEIRRYEVRITCDGGGVYCDAE